MTRKSISFTFFILWATCWHIVAQVSEIKPVTPNASPETKALLEYIYQISGNHILSGQHNYPISRDKNTQFAANYIGKTPIVWSQDFGFSADDKDTYLARPSIIDEAIRQHKKGAIITLCWHAVPPTANEPITFMPLPGYDTAALASVQGHMLEKQYKELLTPGTKIYKNWVKQVDEIAKYLKQLQDAKVPVLWRPYHEMNGGWFWWGGRWQGKYTTAAIYRQIFDRLVNYHKLNNLIWVWSVDRPNQPGREYEKYYPGNQYLDILALDVYGNDFAQSYYEGLMKLSQGKPITLAEVGNPPAPEIIEKQPNWTFWVVWADMTRNTSKSDYEKLVNLDPVLFFEDDTYLNGIAYYRKSCGFEPLTIDRTINLSGEWLLNECETQAQGLASANIPTKLIISHSGNELKIKSFSIVEWGDDEVKDQLLTLDGKDITVKSLCVLNAKWSSEKESIIIDSKTTMNFSGKSFDVKSQEIWALQNWGKKLVIHETAYSPQGKTSFVKVYNKK